ncbi:MAG: hypothetical protein WC208_16060 [Gallionella sp.]|jgi:hypothetical protein
MVENYDYTVEATRKTKCITKKIIDSVMRGVDKYYLVITTRNELFEDGWKQIGEHYTIATDRGRRVLGRGGLCFEVSFKRPVVEGKTLVEDNHIGYYGKGCGEFTRERLIKKWKEEYKNE